MLIQTQAELKRHLPGIDRDLSWLTMEAFVEQVEEMCIVPAIGQAQYDALCNKLDLVRANSEGVSLTAEEKKGIYYLRVAIGHFSYVEALPFLILRTGDGGVMEAGTTTGMQSARQWTTNAAKTQGALNGDRFLEKALEYLELKPDTFTDYASAPERAQDKTLLFTMASQVHRALQIGQSRITYRALVPYLQEVERDRLFPLVGSETAAQLGALPAGDQHAGALRDAREAVACLGAALAIPMMSVRFGSDGLRVITYSDGVQQTLEAKPEQITKYLAGIEAQGEKALARLKTYLDANKPAFPDYATLSAEQSPRVGEDYNNEGKSHFLFPG